MKLFRGEKFGVFIGSNGYYVAEMASDGVSHYQPFNAGNGWDKKTLRKYNEEAENLENEIENNYYEY